MLKDGGGGARASYPYDLFGKQSVKGWFVTLPWGTSHIDAVIRDNKSLLSSKCGKSRLVLRQHE